MADLLWEDTDGLDKYRLVKIKAGESDMYQFERSQQTDSMGADIWHPYSEVPGSLALLLLKNDKTEKLKDIEVPMKGKRISA